MPEAVSIRPASPGPARADAARGPGGGTDVAERGLFERALGLEWPWRVERTEFDAAERRLDLHLDFEAGGTFDCPSCGRGGCKAHDSSNKRWRHLDFFQHRAYLHARVPRVRCPECGVRLARVPWSEPGSGFTLWFEALVVALAREMPVRAVARLVGEHDTRLWRLLRRRVDEARAEADFSEVRAVAVDETACRRGHDYITLFADLDRSRLLYATPGRNASVVSLFRKDLEAHAGSADGVRDICMDMSAAYARGAREAFPEAGVTFDRFHVQRLMNRAVDEVRRAERGERPELNRTRYLWLRRRGRLTASQRERLDELLDPEGRNLRTALAYRIKLAFELFWDLPPRLAETYLDKWCSWAAESGLRPVIAAANTVRKHRKGILLWFRSRITNGMIEGINSLVQAAKARARGYRTTEHFITVAYLVCGKLDFKLPT